MTIYENEAGSRLPALAIGQQCGCCFYSFFLNKSCLNVLLATFVCCPLPSFKNDKLFNTHLHFV